MRRAFARVYPKSGSQHTKIIAPPSKKVISPKSCAAQTRDFVKADTEAYLVRVREEIREWEDAR